MENILYMIVIMTTLIADVATSQCDEGWVSGLDHCYLFVNGSKLDWYHASAACQEQGAELAYFDKLEELTWFRSQLAGHWSYAYWTGLNIPALDFGLLVRNRQWTWGFYRAVDPKLMNGPDFWSQSPAKSDKQLCMGINVQGRFEDLDCSTKQRYACSIQFAGDGSCPRDWYVTDRGCLWFSSGSEPLVTWSEAKDKCWRLDQSDAAHLLTITGVEDSSFIKLFMPSLPPTADVYWTALVANGSQLAWDTGDAYNQQFVRWAAEPDHVARQETCGAIRFNGLFSDRQCSLPLNYVCKR